ncbi:MAG: hypothetical protein ACE366_13290 [Bradymonadia bacterium]
MRSTTYLPMIALLALTAWGCEDSTSSGGGADPDMMAGPMADAEVPDAFVDAELLFPRTDALPGYLQDGGPPPGTPAYVEIALSPRRQFYTLDETPQVQLQVFDRNAELLEGVDMVWSVISDEAATFNRDGDGGTLTFLREGAGAVKACVREEIDLCGRVSFFVDNKAPTLTVESPTPGELLVGANTIEVTGTAEDTGDVRVFVNDAPVEIDENGRFSHTLRPRFGLNRVDVVADDGVRRPASRVVMEVMWAPEVLEASPEGVEIPRAGILRLSQRQLDTGLPPNPPAEDGSQSVDNVAGIIEALISRAEPLGLLRDPVLSAGEPLSLRVVDIGPGRPDATLVFTPEGIEVFLRIEDLEAQTMGNLTFEGERISLDGVIRASAAAFGRLTIESTPNGDLRLSVSDVGVAIEAIGGVLNDSTAQAILDTFGSLLRTVLEDFAVEVVDDLVRTQIPEFLELGLGDVLAPLAEIPLEVPAGGGLPAISITAGFTAETPSVQQGQALEILLSGRVDQPAPVMAPHPDPGVPAAGLEDAPPWPATAGVAVAIQLSAINAVLHEIWRQGVLSLDVSEQLPAQFAALVDSASADGRLPPVVVGTDPGSPFFFELQVGELDLFIQKIREEEPDHYVISLRAGLILDLDDAGEQGTVRFEIAETPDIRVALISQGGNRPLLPTDALARLLETLIWPEIQGALGEGLSFTLDPIELGADAFGAVAPDLNAIRIVPVFPQDPLIRNGWLVLSATFEALMR